MSIIGLLAWKEERGGDTKGCLFLMVFENLVFD